jgi:pseudouridine kinase
MRTLVIGATNIDIIGVSHEKLIEKDSNIGDVSISVGGVAKNIVENLKYLGEDVCFVTYVGKDIFAQLLCKHLDDLNIDYSKSYFSENKNNFYLAIHDFQGDMNYGINDLQNFDLLSPKFFESISDYIDSFDTLVVDCNLSKLSLIYLLNKYQNKKIFVEGVSQVKVKKVSTLLKYVDLLKINNLELNALLNKNICDIIKSVRELHDLGLKSVVVSSSNEPITYNIGENAYQSIVEEPKFIKSTVGAGDALFAGIVKGLNNGKDMHEAINFAKKIAAVTLESESACNKDISKLKDL